MNAIVLRTALAVTGTALIAGCAVAPVGPSLPAYPGSRSTAQQFQVDDVACRDRAQRHFGPVATQASNNAAAANAAGATLFGAALGALLGAVVGDPGTGAAIGAGTGLLSGSVVAADMSGYSSAQMQFAYDRMYSQCMYELGHLVPARTIAHRANRGYPVPSSAAPSAGYPPANAPPPARLYSPPTTASPPGGFPPPDAPPPSLAPR